MRKLNSELTTKYISEIGTEKQNKDYFGFVELDNFACWVLAQGYDNDPTCVSAKLAVDTVINMYTKKPTMSKNKLKKIVKEANRQLKEQSTKFHLKASILIIVSNYTKIRWLVCGNSRLHIFRGSRILEQSKDKTLYQDFIDEGRISENDDTKLQESRNMYGHLGCLGKLDIFVSKYLKLEDDDVLVMSTWGFWEKISTVEMLDALDSSKTPIDFLEQIEDLFLSKQDEKINNYTVVTIFINKTYLEKEKKRKWIKLLIILSVILLIALIILLIFNSRARVRREELIITIAQHESKGDYSIKDENYERALIEYDKGINETNALGGITKKNLLENKEIKESLNNKQRITQLMLDAGSLFQQGNYTQARENYQRILEAINTNDDLYVILNIEKITNLISTLKDYEYMASLLNLAISQEDMGDFYGALQTYEEAREISIKQNDISKSREIKLIINEIDSKLKLENDEIESIQKKEIEEQLQKELEENLLIGQMLELDGYMALSESNYQLALDYYNEALNVYRENNALGNAVQIAGKIIEIGDLIRQQDIDTRNSIAIGYIESGNLYEEENKFEEALEQYKLARDIYYVHGEVDLLKELNEKINSVNDIIRE